MLSLWSRSHEALADICQIPASQNTVAQVFGEKPVEPPNDVGDGAMIDANYLTTLLGIEAGGQHRRVDEPQASQPGCDVHRSHPGKSARNILNLAETSP
jgi:hypothetical protein